MSWVIGVYSSRCILEAREGGGGATGVWFVGGGVGLGARVPGARGDEEEEEEEEEAGEDSEDCTACILVMWLESRSPCVRISVVRRSSFFSVVLQLLTKDVTISRTEAS